MHVIEKALSSVVVLTAFLLTTSAFATNPEFQDMNEDCRGLIVRQAAFQQCLEEDTFPTMKATLDNLAFVCQEWYKYIEDEMKVGSPSWKAWYGVTPENEHIYQLFLNGTLIYRPIPASDEGMIELRISDLINPLEGTFDLSGCGDTDQYLSISTGYRKGMKPENANKLEIWIAPRFMINKHIDSSARHFQPIMDNWEEDTAPFGLFWSEGLWQYSRYDKLTSASPPDISSKNLYENWVLRSEQRERAYHIQQNLFQSSITHSPHFTMHLRYAMMVHQKFFMFICEPK
jgi:hypothetical protein